MNACYPAQTGTPPDDEVAPKAALPVIHSPGSVGHDEIRMLERRGRNPNKGLSRTPHPSPCFTACGRNCLTASRPVGGKLVVR